MCISNFIQFIWIKILEKWLDFELKPLAGHLLFLSQSRYFGNKILKIHLDMLMRMMIWSCIFSIDGKYKKKIRKNIFTQNRRRSHNDRIRVERKWNSPAHRVMIVILNSRNETKWLVWFEFYYIPNEFDTDIKKVPKNMLMQVANQYLV